MAAAEKSGSATKAKMATTARAIAKNRWAPPAVPSLVRTGALQAAMSSAVPAVSSGAGSAEIGPMCSQRLAPAA